MEQDNYGLKDRIECNDGYTASIQASRYSYCTPRETNHKAGYSSFEIGFPNMEDVILIPYAENKDDLMGTVYGYVPVEVIEQLIELHGGFKNIQHTTDSEFNNLKKKIRKLRQK